MECRYVNTPLVLKEGLSKNMALKCKKEIDKMKPISYQNVVGHLMYAMIDTRGNIAKAVELVSQFEILNLKSA